MHPLQATHPTKKETSSDPTKPHFSTPRGCSQSPINVASIDLAFHLDINASEEKRQETTVQAPFVSTQFLDDFFFGGGTHSGKLLISPHLPDMSKPYDHCLHQRLSLPTRTPAWIARQRESSFVGRHGKEANVANQELIREGEAGFLNWGCQIFATDFCCFCLTRWNTFLSVMKKAGRINVFTLKTLINLLMMREEQKKNELNQSIQDTKAKVSKNQWLTWPPTSFYLPNTQEIQYQCTCMPLDPSSRPRCFWKKSHQSNSCWPCVEVAKLQVLPHIEEVLLSKREYTFVQKLQVQQEFEGFKIRWDLHVFCKTRVFLFIPTWSNAAKAGFSVQASVAISDPLTGSS